MKILLNKERYYYKILTLLILLIGFSPIFTRKSWASFILWFSDFRNSYKCLSVLHCNLNNILSNHFFKFRLLISHKSLHKFVKICLSETFLNSGTFSHDCILGIATYIRVIFSESNSPYILKAAMCIFNTIICCRWKF